MDNMSVLDRQYKEMTETSVEKLILRLSVPTIISMLVTNIYNMADTFFVGKLGNKQGDAAIKFASTGFFMSLFLGVLIMIIGIIFMEPLLRIMGSTDTIMPYAKSYGICILLSAPFMTGSCVLNNVLRYEGKASLAMVGLTLGGVLNIIGDPIFIFVFNMGTLGAGISTAVSQVISFFVLLSMFGGDRTVSRLRFSAISWDIKDILNILYTGLPSLIRQGMMSVSTMVLNYMSMPYGDAAIAAMSIVSRVCNFIFAIALGISQGFQPVSAFNFGAKKFKRVKRAFIFCCGLSMIILGILSVLSLIFSGHIIGLFRDDADVIGVGTFALRAQCIVLFVSPITLAASMMFQGAGENLPSSIASFLRSGITFIPMVAILPRFFGIYGIQLAQPVADVISFVVVMPLIVRFFKKINA